MTSGIQLKVCGLTSPVDAGAAAAIGADWIGFIFHPASPRFLSLDKYASFRGELPALPRVAVTVEPDAEEIGRFLELGFDRIQIHFGEGCPAERVKAWSAAVGPERLWLAPRLPPAADVADWMLPLARTFLLDTFQADGFGGSGRTGDWAKVARHIAGRPEHAWILAGGLRPENIAAAIGASGARWVDVNSGVESGPGIKDHRRLAALKTALAALAK